MAAEYTLLTDIRSKCSHAAERALFVTDFMLIYNLLVHQWFFPCFQNTSQLQSGIKVFLNLRIRYQSTDVSDKA